MKEKRISESPHPSEDQCFIAMVRNLLLAKDTQKAQSALTENVTRS